MGAGGSRAAGEEAPFTIEAQLESGAGVMAAIAAAQTCTNATSGPIRVMHLMYQLRFGGMELGVVKLVNAIDRARVASSVCSCRPATDAKYRLAPHVPLVELRRRNGNDPFLVARLVALMRRERPHVLHTHAWGTLCEGLLAARLARVPVIVHGEHGTLETRRRNVAVQRWAWRRVDQVLSVSSTLAARMAGQMRFPVEHIKTIRNGVDVVRFVGGDRRAARAAFGFEEADVVVGTVGRLVPVKNQIMLVEALARVRQRDVRVSGLIAGDGPLRRDLEERARALGIAPFICFIGERNDVEQVFAAMDVFALTSLSEGLSNTIQEAMASALPVVATRVGGADELARDGETGILVPSGDSDALAAALEHLALNSERRRDMGRAGRERAEREFSLTGMIQHYEDLYVELAARFVRRNQKERVAYAGNPV
jgi:sugar transferase (PEP-CTERM/EpsH1 system associated)